MPNWLIKSKLQRAISKLPHPEWWNDLFQTYVTHSQGLGPGAFENYLDRCRKHFDSFLHGERNPPDHFTIVELGTGWFPAIPIGLYLCGASEIWTFDIVRLLRRKRLKLLLEYFCDFDERGVLVAKLPWVRKERVQQLRQALTDFRQKTPEQVLEQLNIHALIRDARTTGLAPASVDFFFSTAVLGHISREVIGAIFAESKRIAKPGAIMSHFIGMNDQFASFDHSLTPFNFLRYSDARWKRLDSPLIPQNRLRISDYRQLISETGWRIIRESNESGSIRELERIPLAQEFQTYSREDLLVLFTWISAELAGVALDAQTLPAVRS